MAANETPPFWFEKPGLKAWLLWPIAALYSRAASVNMLAAHTAEVPVPVLCIGNFVVGGGGKTPTALALAGLVEERGMKPGFLSRGYGGKVNVPTVVDLQTHNALDVGDEPLLLANKAPIVVSADREAGAKLLVEQGCNFIIMDDGFQNSKLLKDYSLVVVDSRRGIGNGFPMPAGPLRVRLADQLGKADAVLVIGDENGADPVIRKTARSGRPVYHARYVVEDPLQWKNKWVLPFAGIADPGKFFDTLRKHGADLAAYSAFGDHHYFHEDEAKELLDRAELMKAQLVTTEKDHARLKGMGYYQEKLANQSELLRIHLEFDENATPDIIIDKTLSRFEKRILVAEKSA